MGSAGVKEGIQGFLSRGRQERTAGVWFTILTPRALLAGGREAEPARSSSLRGCGCKTSWGMSRAAPPAEEPSLPSALLSLQDKILNPKIGGGVKSPKKTQPGVQPTAAKECFGISTLQQAVLLLSALITAPGKCPFCCCGLGECESGTLHCFTSHGIYSSSRDQLLNLHRLSKCLFFKIFS